MMGVMGAMGVMGVIGTMWMGFANRDSQHIMLGQWTK